MRTVNALCELRRALRAFLWKGVDGWLRVGSFGVAHCQASFMCGWPLLPIGDTHLPHILM
jgi:hypothetical protein